MNRVRIVAGVIGVCVGLDQLTKEIAQKTLRGMGRHSYLGDTFRFEYSENPGAFLSLGAGLSPEARFWVLTVMVALSLAAAVFYLLRSKDLTPASIYGMALVVGGGASNLIDRAFRPAGAVVDFMNMGIGDLRTGIFNIADMAIMAGVGILLWASFTQGSQSSHAAQTPKK